MTIKTKIIITWLKSIFSIKVILGLMIILLSSLNVYNITKLSVTNKKINMLNDSYNYCNNMSKIMADIDGSLIGDLDLKNHNGLQQIHSILKDNNYHIIIYQNGIVCDPCLEFVVSKWGSSINELHENLSKKIILISDSFDRSVLRFLNKNQMEDQYFIDTQKMIRNSIVKNDFPMNFLFLINSNRQIVYSSYFDTDTKENFNDFLIKANRYIKNNKASAQ